MTICKAPRIISANCSMSSGTVIYGLVFPAIEVISTQADGTSRVVGTHIHGTKFRCYVKAPRGLLHRFDIPHYYQVYGLFLRELLQQNLRYNQRAGKTLNCDVPACSARLDVG